MALGTIRVGGGGAGGLRGASPRGYNSASGGIPGVTSPVDAITGNLGNLGGIINSITGSQSTALRDQYPDEYFSTLGTLLGNTQRRAAGDISDLLPELQQNSAEDAVYGGMSGSGAENTKLLRDLGLTRYGVQNSAIDALSKIQGQIPTVRPFDPSGIIAGQMAAQERADLYASAPVPEDAYRRAMDAAGGGGGGGGRTGGLSYNLGGGGGQARNVDAVLGGYAAPTIQYGTGGPMGSSTGYAPWGSFPDAVSGSGGAGGYGGGVDEWLTTDYQPQYQSSSNQDFGGSINYGGGDPWAGLNTDLFGGSAGTDASGFTNYPTPNYDPVIAGGGELQNEEEWLTELLSGGGGYYDE